MRIFNYNIDTELLKVKIKYRWLLFMSTVRQKNTVIPIASSFFALSLLIVGVVYIRQRQIIGVQAEGIKLQLLAGGGTYKIGDEFTVDVYIDSKGLKITGTDVKIKYDPNLIQAESILPANFLPVVFVPGQLSNGEAHIVLGCDPTKPKSGNGILAHIKFKVLAQSGNTSISFIRDNAIAVLGQSTNAVGEMSGLTIATGDAVQQTPSSGSSPISPATPVVSSVAPSVIPTTVAVPGTIVGPTPNEPATSSLPKPGVR